MRMRLNDDYAASIESQLKRGSKGEEVRELQTKLKDLGYDIAVDGSFGKGTMKVVKQFQKDHNLKIDGVVGPNTYGVLAAEKGKLKTNVYVSNTTKRSNGITVEINGSMINVDEEEAKIRKQEEQKNKKMIFNNKTKSLNSVAKEDVYEKDEAEYEIKASNDSVTYPEVYDTTDHNLGELESGVQGLASIYNDYYTISKYNCSSNVVKKTMKVLKNDKVVYKFSEARRYHNLYKRYDLKFPRNIKGCKTMGRSIAKKAFTKGAIALAVIGIGLDTADDVVQLKKEGATEDVIRAAVATDVTFGAVGAGLSITGAAAAGALAGSAVCPLFGTVVGVAVSIGISMLFDSATSSPKQKIKNWLVDIF